jgi:large subunit ribosomal protein L15
MKLHALRPAQGSIVAPKRIGRGGCRGGTSTRGHNGAKSRSGYSSKRGFEGGQRPLQQRIPKFGFKNVNRVEYKSVNLFIIQNLAVTHNLSVVDMEVLNKYGILSKKAKCKVLGVGDINSGLSIYAHAFSESAKKKITDVNSKFCVISHESTTV